MDNPLNETMSAAREGVKSLKDAAEDALGNAIDTMGHAKEQIGRRGPRVFSSVLRGLTAAMSLGALVRQLDSEPVLRFFGLSRRRSIWGSFAIFGAGMAAGAGVALFLSPTSGQETRQRLLRGVRSISRKGQELIKEAESQIGALTQGEGNGERGQAGRANEAGQSQGGQRNEQSRAGENKSAASRPATPGGTSDTQRSSIGGSEGTLPSTNRPQTDTTKPYRSP